jgi:hypothetical protein
VMSLLAGLLRTKLEPGVCRSISLTSRNLDFSEMYYSAYTWLQKKNICYHFNFDVVNPLSGTGISVTRKTEN